MVILCLQARGCKHKRRFYKKTYKVKFHKKSQHVVITTNYRLFSPQIYKRFITLSINQDYLLISALCDFSLRGSLDLQSVVLFGFLCCC